AEDEIRRRVRVPARIALRTLQGVERAIELDRRQRARRVLQLAPLRQSFRVELTAPGRIAPAGDADADVCDQHGTRVCSMPRGRPGGRGMRLPALCGHK